jgi:putative sterol carrier protein
MALYGTQEWLNHFKEALNTNSRYEEAAAEWEGDFYFVSSPSDTFPNELTMYLNLKEGKCLEAELISDPDLRSPEFTVKGATEVWMQIINKELDPMQAIMTGKLNMKGNMSKIMKNLKAANELVNSLSLVQTEFPPAA